MDSTPIRPLLRRTHSTSEGSPTYSETASDSAAQLGSDTQKIDETLAICLVGQAQANQQVKAQFQGEVPDLDQGQKEPEGAMHVAEYEEEIRQRAVMQEVLPDAAMWAKWEATEAPLRRGRGWYPTLDRHFLELLVISEIACLSHPLAPSPGTAAAALPAQPGQAERIHRHSARVRRVACERIGTERLHAYVDRVREAFGAYLEGPWGLVSPELPGTGASAGAARGAAAGDGAGAVGERLRPEEVLGADEDEDGREDTISEESDEDEDEEEGGSGGESGVRDAKSPFAGKEAPQPVQETDVSMSPADGVDRTRGRSFTRNADGSMAKRPELIATAPHAGQDKAATPIFVRGDPDTQMSGQQAAMVVIHDDEMEELMDIEVDNSPVSPNSPASPGSPSWRSTATVDSLSVLVTPSSPMDRPPARLIKGTVHELIVGGREDGTGDTIID